MSKYKEVYFRVNTPSYYKNKYGVGFENNEDREQFFNNVKEIFLNDGWEKKIKKYESASSCPTVIKNKQELYLHPQEFTGIVLEENIKHIEKLISNSNLFEYKHVDIYEDVFDISDEEYTEILKSKQSEIEKDILEIFKTKRKNLYITSRWNVGEKILSKYRIKRLKQSLGTITSDNLDYCFIQNVIDELVAQNKIVTAKCKNGTGYRTINKTEQKELGIAI